MSNKNNLLLLFDRPLEPIFMEKGPNNTKFEVPDRFLSDRYRGTTISDRFGSDSGDRVPIRSDISIPNLKVPASLGRDEKFSLFIPRHRRIAGHLINIFMGTNYIL